MSLILPFVYKSISSLSQPGHTLPTAKRNSHYRRSFVSTPQESADVMGVTLLALSNSSVRTNELLRVRALWALEGKLSPDGFSPIERAIEIPELSTPEFERRISKLRTVIYILRILRSLSLTPWHSEQATVPSLHW